MIESEWVTLISNVGFPIAMTFYLLFRFEKVLNKNTDALDRLIKK